MLRLILRSICARSSGDEMSFNTTLVLIVSIHLHTSSARVSLAVVKTEVENPPQSPGVVLGDFIKHPSNEKC